MSLRNCYPISTNWNLQSPESETKVRKDQKKAHMAAKGVGAILVFWLLASGMVSYACLPPFLLLEIQAISTL